MEEAMKFPRDKEQYLLTAVIATTEGATTYRAKHYDVLVGIKIFNLDKIKDIYSLTTEVHEAEKYDHENMVKIHCSFKINDQLWLITPWLGLSIRSIIQTSFQCGLPEDSVSFILRESLKALNYMHGKNKLHHNIDANCIFLDKDSNVKLSFNSLSYDRTVNPNWTIAPELMVDYEQGNNKATDVWSFGLLALELFHGKIPASNFEDFQMLIYGIQDEFGILKKKQNIHQETVNSRFFENFRVLPCFTKQTKKNDKKKIPEELGKVMAACLSRDPKKRPTTNQLMEYELFQKCFLQDSLIELKKACKFN